MNSLEPTVDSQNPGKEKNNSTDCSYSNLQNDSFSKIAEQAEIVHEITLGALNTNQKSQEQIQDKLEQDSRVLELSEALDNLRKSPNFELVKAILVEKFWDQSKTIPSALLKMTMQELAETPAKEIIFSSNVRISRLELLHKIIERIIEGRELTDLHKSDDSEDNSNLIIENATQAVREAIDEIRVKSTASTRALADVFEQSNSVALVCTYLCQFSVHRRVGKIYGVTEARIYQHIKKANADVLENLLKTEPEMLKNIELRLHSPACSEKALSAMLGLADLSEKAATLLRILVRAFGAVNPSFKKRTLRTHWSLRSNKFESQLSKLYAELPLKTKKLSARLEEVLVGCYPPEVISILPPTIFFLRSKDLWCLNQEQAVVTVLKSKNAPVKIKELAEIFEIDAERPLKQVLTKSKHIVKSGKKSGVTYSVISE